MTIPCNNDCTSCILFDLTASNSGKLSLVRWKKGSLLCVRCLCWSQLLGCYCGAKATSLPLLLDDDDDDVVLLWNCIKRNTVVANNDIERRIARCRLAATGDDGYDGIILLSSELMLWRDPSNHYYESRLPTDCKERSLSDFFSFSTNGGVRRLGGVGKNTSVIDNIWRPKIKNHFFAPSSIIEYISSR